MIRRTQGVTPETIAADFGQRVAAIIMEVTDDKALPKAERKRSQDSFHYETKLNMHSKKFLGSSGNVAMRHSFSLAQLRQERAT
jgi:(p)ppGpp synthase/HD superfamily hydrolase